MNLYVGFDIGGTSIKHLVVDQDLHILESNSFPTQSQLGAAGTIKTMVDVVHSYANAYRGTVKAVGVGCTGPVNIETGEIQNPYTLPGFEGHSLSASMEPELGVPVVVENDANTAHVGEVAFSKRQIDNSMMITFGTGVGVSVRLGGSLFRIPGAIHPEIGHISVGVDSDESCYCNKTRCFEHVMSGTAINRYAYETFGRSPEAVLQDSESDEAQAFINRLVTASTDAIVTLSVIFQPEIVFISGGMHGFYCRHVMEPVQERLDRLMPMYGKTTLVEAQMGPDAGCYGAAVIAVEHMGRLGDQHLV
ncbi:MAG: ROK family protein [Sphaerochaetaceae bacterium]